MKDKVLQRRLFREKALKKYGGDMLPKFQNGTNQGGVEVEKTKLEELYPSENQSNTGSLLNKLAGLGALAQPYDSRQAMLLAVAGRLLQAQQKPGEGMFSGVGRGVGKAITEDFPIIKKLSLEDRAARLKTGSLNLTEVYDVNEGINKKVPYEEIQSLPKRYIAPQKDNYKFNVTEEVTVDFGDEKRTFKPGKTYDLASSKKYYDIFTGNKFENLKNVMVAPDSDLDTQFAYDAKKQKIDAYKKPYGAFVERSSATSELNGLLSDGINLITQEGAKTGVVGQTQQLFASLKGVTNAVIGETKYTKYNYEEAEADMERFLEGGELELDDGTKITTKDIAGFKLFKDGALGTAAQARTLFTELAYLMAKSREEGGRFSVTDIQLAFDAIGMSSNSNQLLSGLVQIGKTYNGRILAASSILQDIEDDDLSNIYSSPTSFKINRDYCKLFNNANTQDVRTLLPISVFTNKIRSGKYGKDDSGSNIPQPNK